MTPRVEVLSPNLPRRFYRGGARLARWRRTTVEDAWRPEDWIGSCTSTHDDPSAGLSRLPDGRLLHQAIAEDPEGWLGATHVERFGANPALLAKILDPSEDIPVHCHPDDKTARAVFGSHWGKAEAWLLLSAWEEASVQVGFREELSAAELAELVGQGAIGGLLNEVPVTEHDAIFVPPGLPHAIPPGVMILEVQQPTDLSVMLDGSADPDASELECVDRSAWTAERLASLRNPIRRESLLPAAADRYFRLDRHIEGHVLEAGFSILVADSGEGTLEPTTGDVPAVELTEGTALVVPHAAGELTVTGDLVVLSCRPPDPAAVT